MAHKFNSSEYIKNKPSPSQDKIRHRIETINDINSEGPGKIQCLLDNTWHYEITSTYLKSIGSTLVEYKRQFPDAPIRTESKFSDEQRQQLSTNMSANWQKHKQGQVSAATLAIKSRKKTP